MADLNERDQLFISYSHSDEQWLEHFRLMLEPVQKVCALEIWSDKNIKPGENWKEDIENAISRAKVALLLVSDAFLASNFIQNSELPMILNNHAKGGLRIYWVSVGPALVEYSPLSNLQAAYQIKTSLTEIHDAGEQKRIIANICRQIANELGQYSSVDRSSRKTFMENLQESLKSEIEIIKEIGAGDFSFVYHGKRMHDGQEVAVKAIVTSPLQTWAIERFEEHIQKARILANPCFIKIFEVKLREAPHILVMEKINDSTLRDMMRDCVRLAPHRVSSILYQIATALSEAHQAGLIYGSLRPCNMYLREDDVVRIPAVDLSNELVRFERMRGVVVTSYEMLTYMIPELYVGNTLTHKSDQYFLGLLALELLNGTPPVRINCTSDFEAKRKFFDDPRQSFESWRADDPGLTRVIVKLLSKNPDQRWPTMASVASMLKSVSNQGGWEDPLEALVKESYNKYCKGNFYKLFYNQFFKLNPDTQKFFMNISMRRQYRMLDEAVAQLINFRVGPEPTVLSRTARSHERLGLGEKHYKDFSHAFIATLQAVGEDDEDTLNAWRCLFARGTEYMLRRD